MLDISSIKPDTYLTSIPEPALLQQLENHCNSGNHRVRSSTLYGRLRINVSSAKSYISFTLYNGRCSRLMALGRSLDLGVDYIAYVPEVSVFGEGVCANVTLTGCDGRLVFLDDKSGAVLLTVPWSCELRETFSRLL